MENKFKIERLNYIFCIGENQKEIEILKRQLNMESIDKLPKEELNKVICYPKFTKFEVVDEINPKLIPMYLSNKCKHLTPKTMTRNKSQKSNKDSKDFNQLFKTELKQYRDNISFSINNSNKKEDNNKFDILDYENEEDKKKINENEKKENEINELIELGQKYVEQNSHKIDRIFSKKRKFFLSHPKLNYIKNISSGNNIIRWKLGNQINSLPKQISKLKTLSTQQKKTIVVFPSLVNETLINIEKLKINQFFRNIDNK